MFGVDVSDSLDNCEGDTAEASGISVTISGSEKAQFVALPATVCSNPLGFGDIQIGPSTQNSEPRAEGSELRGRPGGFSRSL
jgi:hypothetical protein